MSRLNEFLKTLRVGDNEIEKFAGQAHVFKPKKEGKKRQTFSPSSLGKCVRFLVWNFLEPEVRETFAFLNQMKMDNGTDRHAGLLPRLQEIGMLKEIELEVSNSTYRIYGRLDARLQFNDLPPHVFEFKTMNSTSFRKVKDLPSKGWDGLYSVFPGYCFQLMAYMLCTGDNHGVVLCEEKDTQKWKEFWLTKDEKIMGELISKLEMMIDHIDRGVLPKRKYGSPNNTECSYCPRKQGCWKN
jgi:hypothetical protein